MSFAFCDPWCCPVCGRVNHVEGEFSAAGYCQGQACLDARAWLLRTGREALNLPEAWAAFARRPEASA